MMNKITGKIRIGGETLSFTAKTNSNFEGLWLGDRQTLGTGQFSDRTGRKLKREIRWNLAMMAGLIDEKELPRVSYDMRYFGD